MHYNYKIHYQPGDKNCTANALSQHAELKPLDGEDNQLLCLIPETKFSEIAACEAELTDSDWQDLTDIILTALTISDMDILCKTQRILQDWQDKPEGLEWEDGLGWKDGWIWIPEEDCDDIAIFPLFFLIPLRSLYRSVPLLPLHSAPSPTHDPPIFQYFVDRRRASRISAPPC